MTPPETSPFALTLRARLGGWSVRALGRELEPDDPERGRRKVQRILSGSTKAPTITTRMRLAEILGVDPAEFAIPADEPRDEDAPISHDEWRIYRSVQRRLERHAPELVVAA